MLTQIAFMAAERTTGGTYIQLSIFMALWTINKNAANLGGGVQENEIGANTGSTRPGW